MPHFLKSAPISHFRANEKNPGAKAPGFCFLVLYTSQHEADIGGGNGEKQGIHTVEGSAVTGDEIAEILDTDHTLDK